MEKFTNIDTNEKKPNIFEKFRKKFGNNLYLAIVVISSFAISPKEGVSQTNIDNIDTIKKSISVDEKAKLEFEKQKEFLISWYSNRKINNNKYQKKFEEIRPEVLERLKEVSVLKSSTIFGTAEWRNDTIFYDDAILNKPELNSAFTHEFSHDAFPANYGDQPKKVFQTEMPSYMISMIANAIKKSGDEGLSDVALFTKYYQRPEEVYARICAFRLVFDLKSNQNITLNELQEIIKKINNKEINDDNSNLLLKTITDSNSLLSLLNNLP